MKTNTCLSLSFISLMLIACGSDKIIYIDGDKNCQSGSIGCECYGNDTCDEELTCYKGVCLFLPNYDGDKAEDSTDGDLDQIESEPDDTESEETTSTNYLTCPNWDNPPIYVGTIVPLSPPANSGKWQLMKSPGYSLGTWWVDNSNKAWIVIDTPATGNQNYLFTFCTNSDCCKISFHTTKMYDRTLYVINRWTNQVWDESLEMSIDSELAYNDDGITRSYEGISDGRKYSNPTRLIPKITTMTVNYNSVGDAYDYGALKYPLEYYTLADMVYLGKDTPTNKSMILYSDTLIICGGHVERINEAIGYIDKGTASNPFRFHNFTINTDCTVSLPE